MIKSAMAWTCMAAFGTFLLIFTDEGTHHGSIRINSDITETILNLQRNASNLNFMYNTTNQNRVQKQ